MRVRDEDKFLQKKASIMRACFDCYAEKGLQGTGISSLAKSAGISKASLYTYFENVDQIILESTAYCMKKVEDDVMRQLPHTREELLRVVDTFPQWLARNHGKRYRLMHQVYSHPRYHGERMHYLDDVNARWTRIAGSVASILGLPEQTIKPLVFIYMRAAQNYAMFGDAYYLDLQVASVKTLVQMYERHNTEQ